MGTKMKGICKSFKNISQFFVVKEREMEIGYPTDVKHVAHIGWESQSANAPTWMNEFKTCSDFSVTSLSDLGDRSNCFPFSTWSSQDFEQSMAQQPASDMFRDSPPPDLPKVPKKHKQKKAKSLSSSPNSSSSSSRTTRASKSKALFVNPIKEAEIPPKI